MADPIFIELLEPRQLLTGVTLLAPAWNGGLTGWLQTAINGITADLGGPQNVPQYVLTIAPNSNGTLAIQGVSHTAGTPTPQASNPGQIIVTLDYTSVSTNPDYPMTQIAGLITNFMENTPVDGVLWASLPIHDISTSRGTALIDAINQSLDTSGIWVDQETYIDPDPDTSAPFFDNLNAVYDNVEFADDYWRQNPDGSNPGDNPSGHPIAGAYNLDLTWVQADFSGFGLAHLAPPAYYDGTIDPAFVGGSDGDGPIHTDWYGNGSTPTTFPSASQTGFLYSAIDGGTRPLSGLWAASGGTGQRTAVTHTGLQWPNVSDVASDSGSTLQTGGTLGISYIQQDRSEADNITFYLDSDQNPFDGTTYTLGSASGIAASSTINPGTFSASLAGVTPGTYYVDAKITDSSGLVRYDSSIKQITIASTGAVGSLSGTQSAAAASYNLTALGTGDWAHWGTGGNVNTFDHKASGGSQISNVTNVGSGGFGAYADASRDVSWTDGTPLASDAGDDGYVWANNGIGAGYSFTVPASTTPRMVYIYAGGYSSGSTLTAHLSDGSASNYVVNLSGSGHYSDIIAITYSSAFAGQTLTITDVKSSNINGTGGSVDLMAAWFTATAVAGTAPAVWTGPTSQTVAAGAIVNFTASSVNGNPTPTVQWQISTNHGASYTAIPGATSLTYSFTATTAQNGDLYEAVFTNTAGSATTLPASLTVTGGTSGTTGILSGVQSTAAASYNLTTLGTTDWAHWGLGGNASAFDHKSTGASQISNVTEIGSGGFGGYSDSSRDVSWTDGTPLTSESGDDGYIWANNGIGAGYSFTVPASTTTHSLYLYLGGYSSGSTLTAHLSDSSAPDYVVSLSGSSHYTDLIAITFKAGSAGQTLTLSYVKSQNINGTGGSADLIAAALV